MFLWISADFFEVSNFAGLTYSKPQRGGMSIETPWSPEIQAPGECPKAFVPLILGRHVENDCPSSAIGGPQGSGLAGFWYLGLKANTSATPIRFDSILV